MRACSDDRDIRQPMEAVISAPDRRAFISGLSSLLAFAAAAESAAGQTTGKSGGKSGSKQTGAAPARFSHEEIVTQARTLAEKPFSPPPRVPEKLTALGYEQYRKIRFRKERAIWGKTPSRFSIELFAPGFLFRDGIDVFIVESGKVHPVPVNIEAFDTPSQEIGQALAALGKLAGFRLHYPINGPEYQDEFIVFQGASFFRAVSRGQTYGLSARGLAIDVAESTGEEIPIFRRFWIERPAASAESIVVHALLDSRRVAGAYRFGIYPGGMTVVDVQMTLFPRRTLHHVGLGGLNSMFLFGTIDPSDGEDYRPAVHDSLGLAIHTGRGERIWRPLQNPRQLQISAFIDRNPKGFGLVQRDRRFTHFQDLEARYQTRPSAWVTPKGDWGPGKVVLLEIPSKSASNDNIVAYWRPDAELEFGAKFTASYRLSWGNHGPGLDGLAPVRRSAQDRVGTGSRRQIVVDYGRFRNVPTEALQVDVQLSTGNHIDTQVRPNPETGGVRVFVTFDPEGTDLIEFRLQPKQEGKPVGETWLFRWTRR